MRKTRMLKISDTEITVKELTVKDILAVVDTLGSGDIGAASMKDQVETLLPLACDLPPEKFIEFAPSELKELLDAFTGVNAVFFDLARSAGLGDLVKEISASIRKDFSSAFAALSKPGISAPETTE